MLNLLGMIFGWNWRIRKLRKRWDRLREKTLKKNHEVRAALLSREDQIESNIIALEERSLRRGERARIFREVELDLAEIKEMLKAKPEEFRQPQKTQQQPAQNQEGKEKE